MSEQIESKNGGIGAWGLVGAAVIGIVFAVGRYEISHQGDEDTPNPTPSNNLILPNLPTTLPPFPPPTRPGAPSPTRGSLQECQGIHDKAEGYLAEAKRYQYLIDTTDDPGQAYDYSGRKQDALSAHTKLAGNYYGHECQYVTGPYPRP